MDPPLGWPWPKHACFDKPGQPTRTFSTWSAKSSGFTKPKLGVVTHIRSEPGTEDPLIQVRLTDDSTPVSLILRWTPPEASLLGAMVILSKEDSLLLHPDYGEIPFHSFRLQPLGAHGWYKCDICGASVRVNTGHEAYCRGRHQKPKVVPAEATVPAPIQTKAPNRQPQKQRRKPFKSLIVYSAKPANRSAFQPPKQPSIKTEEEAAKARAWLRRLNWTEKELREQEKEIVIAITKEATHIADDTQAFKTAKALAFERIRRLPRPLPQPLAPSLRQEQMASTPQASEGAWIFSLKSKTCKRLSEH